MDKSDGIVKELTSLYSQINLAGMKAILNGQEKPDPILNNLEQDQRLGLALIITLTGSITERFQFLMEQIGRIEPEQYYYPVSDLHLTILEFVSAHEDFRRDEAVLDKSGRVVEQAIHGLPPFAINFNGIIASNAAIIVKGYYKSGLLQLRERIRKIAPEHGIHLQERYQSISAHSTMVRFKKNLQNRAELLGIVQKYSEFDIGTSNVNEIELTVHDWYNRKKEGIRKFILR